MSLPHYQTELHAEYKEEIWQKNDKLGAVAARKEFDVINLKIDSAIIEFIVFCQVLEMFWSWKKVLN